MKAGQHFTYTNKKGVTKEFIAVYDTPKKETDKSLLMKIHYAADAEPRQKYTRRFVKSKMEWL